MSEAKEPQRRSLGRGLGSLLGEDVVESFKTTPPGVALERTAVATVRDPGKASFKSTRVTAAASTEPAEVIPETQRVWQVDIEKLIPNSFQPRRIFVQEKIQELAASIKEKGILQPIIARRVDRDRFEIIAGERRWRAAQVAGLQRVPVILKEVKNQESLELALIENIQRHDLNPIEEAEAYQQLAQEFSLSQQEISQKVGKERATVANTLRLLQLPAEVRQMLAQGDLSTGHAKALLALTDAEKLKALAQKITSEKLTVRAAEKLIQSVLRKKTEEEPRLSLDVSAKLIEGLQDDLAKALGTKVQIQYNKGRGQISIQYYTDEDLTRIIEKIKS